MVKYNCVQIKGVANLLAFLLPRWGPSSNIHRLVNISHFLFLTSSHFWWTTLTNLVSIQFSSLRTRPNVVDLVDRLLCNAAHAVWMRDDDAEPQRRLCVIAHTGADGHWGCFSTLQTLQYSFSGRLWRCMSSPLHVIASIFYQPLVGVEGRCVLIWSRHLWIFVE